VYVSRLASAVRARASRRRASRLAVRILCCARRAKRRRFLSRACAICCGLRAKRLRPLSRSAVGWLRERASRKACLGLPRFRAVSPCRPSPVRLTGHYSSLCGHLTLTRRSRGTLRKRASPACSRPSPYFVRAVHFKIALLRSRFLARVVPAQACAAASIMACAPCPSGKSA
jgi:hypothetical protein